MKEYIKKTIIKGNEASMDKTEDLLAVEQKLRISVNGKEVLSLYCTPTMIRELVAGLFMTEGIIKGEWCMERMTIVYGDIIDVDIPAAGEVSLRGGVITSGCVGGITFTTGSCQQKLTDTFSMDIKDIKDQFSRFQSLSGLYKLTGCVHSAAMSDGKNIVCFAEDIGRHNAVDKVIGYALLEDIKFNGKIMLCSGRISSEISSKCMKWGIPVIASRTAPTALAVDIAEKSGITIIGFIRGSRFNVYSCTERIANSSGLP